MEYEFFKEIRNLARKDGLDGEEFYRDALAGGFDSEVINILKLQYKKLKKKSKEDEEEISELKDRMSIVLKKLDNLEKDFNKVKGLVKNSKLMIKTIEDVQGITDIMGPVPKMLGIIADIEANGNNSDVETTNPWKQRKTVIKPKRIYRASQLQLGDDIRFIFNNENFILPKYETNFIIFRFLDKSHDKPIATQKALKIRAGIKDGDSNRYTCILVFDGIFMGPVDFYFDFRDLKKTEGRRSHFFGFTVDRTTKMIYATTDGKKANTSLGYFPNLVGIRYDENIVTILSLPTTSSVYLNKCKDDHSQLYYKEKIVAWPQKVEIQNVHDREMKNTMEFFHIYINYEYIERREEGRLRMDSNKSNDALKIMLNYTQRVINDTIITNNLTLNIGYNKGFSGDLVLNAPLSINEFDKNAIPIYNTREVGIEIVGDHEFNGIYRRFLASPILLAAHKNAFYPAKVTQSTFNFDSLMPNQLNIPNDFKNKYTEQSITLGGEKDFVVRTYIITSEIKESEVSMFSRGLTPDTIGNTPTQETMRVFPANEKAWKKPSDGLIVNSNKLPIVGIREVHTGSAPRKDVMFVAPYANIDMKIRIRVFIYKKGKKLVAPKGVIIFKDKDKSTTETCNFSEYVIEEDGLILNGISAVTTQEWVRKFHLMTHPKQYMDVIPIETHPDGSGRIGEQWLVPLNGDNLKRGDDGKIDLDNLDNMRMIMQDNSIIHYFNKRKFKIEVSMSNTLRKLEPNDAVDNYDYWINEFLPLSKTTQIPQGEVELTSSFKQKHVLFMSEEWYDTNLPRLKAVDVMPIGPDGLLVDEKKVKLDYTLVNAIQVDTNISLVNLIVAEEGDSNLDSGFNFNDGNNNEGKILMNAIFTGFKRSKHREEDNSNMIKALQEELEDMVDRKDSIFHVLMGDLDNFLQFACPALLTVMDGAMTTIEIVEAIKEYAETFNHKPTDLITGIIDDMGQALDGLAQSTGNEIDKIALGYNDYFNKVGSGLDEVKMAEKNEMMKAVKDYVGEDIMNTGSMLDGEGGFISSWMPGTKESLYNSVFSYFFGNSDARYSNRAEGVLACTFYNKDLVTNVGAVKKTYIREMYIEYYSTSLNFIDEDSELSHAMWMLSLRSSFQGDRNTKPTSANSLRFGYKNIDVNEYRAMSKNDFIDSINRCGIPIPRVKSFRERRKEEVAKNYKTLAKPRTSVDALMLGYRLYKPIRK